MELLHAYSTARLIKPGVVSPAGGGWAKVKGTPLRWRTTVSAATPLPYNAQYGIAIAQISDALGIDLTPYVTGGTDPYWITVGFRANVFTDRGANSSSGMRIYAAPDSSYADLVSAKTLFGGIISQVYVEFSLNPTTGEWEVYSNGKLVGNGTTTFRFLTLVSYISFSETIYVADVYVARFDNVERHWLRRWSCSNLVPVTNNIGPNILLTDGSTSTVGETPLSATYAIPGGVLGVAVDVSAVSPDLASGLKVALSDGTKSITKSSSEYIRTLNADGGAVGHAVPYGGLTPTKDATTLTVTATAVDRT